VQVAVVVERMCGALQVAGKMVEMIKTGATGVNFDLEMPLKVLWRGPLGALSSCCARRLASVLCLSGTGLPSADTGN
jgi:hypothetical protein